jgi:hypothetical protein
MSPRSQKRFAMLVPVVSVLVTRDIEADGRKYSSGGRYTMATNLVKKLKRLFPGAVRVIVEDGRPERSDKMMHGEGIRYG